MFFFSVCSLWKGLFALSISIMVPPHSAEPDFIASPAPFPTASGDISLRCYWFFHRTRKVWWRASNAASRWKDVGRGKMSRCGHRGCEMGTQKLGFRRQHQHCFSDIKDRMSIKRCDISVTWVQFKVFWTSLKILKLRQNLPVRISHE